MKRLIYATLLVIVMMTLILPNALAAHQHIWGEWKWEKGGEPTCQKEGKQVRVCLANNCGQHDRRTVAKVPHDFDDATCTKPATCKFKCGTTTGTALGHSYKPATCVAKETCRRCGDERGNLGDHRFTTATCIKKATCIYCGVTTGNYGQHRYKDGRCTWCGVYEYIICDQPTDTE